MEGYIYLGEHYDVLGREITITDKKIGLSINPVSRENQLNRTKSPIGYRIISVYKVDNMNRVEKMLHAILDSRRVHGEWFKDDEDTLIASAHSSDQENTEQGGENRRYWLGLSRLEVNRGLELGA